MTFKEKNPTIVGLAHIEGIFSDKQLIATAYEVKQLNIVAPNGLQLTSDTAYYGIYAAGTSVVFTGDVSVTLNNSSAEAGIQIDSGELSIFGDVSVNLENGFAKASLNEFAKSLLNNPQTDVQIYGHTDNVGTRAANEKVSNARATEVKNYLSNAGVPGARLTSQGLAYDYPVASNDTEAGRAQNRRVEIYITANEDMIKAAQEGTLE